MRSELTTVACVSLLLVGTVQAQTLPSPSGSADENTASTQTLPEIRVAETRNPEIPLAFSASVQRIDGSAVEKGRIEHLGDLAKQAANVYLADMTRGAPHLIIRGMGFSDDESDGISNHILIDGVQVYSHALGQLFDLERMDIRRGAQLTGSGSGGGVVELITRDPAMTFGGTAQVDYGTGHRRRATAALDVPLAQRTAVRLSAGIDKADGYVKNIVLNRNDTAGWDARFARLKLLHQDESGGQWRLGLHHVDSEGGNDFYVPVEYARKHQSNNTEAGRNDTGYTLVTGEYHGQLAGGQELLVRLGAHRSRWSYWNPVSVYGAISGQDIRNRSASLEAQLRGGDGRLDWQIGSYLTWQKRHAPYTFDMTPFFKSATSADIRGTTAAAFGELGYHIAQHWRLAGGLRLEHNRREMDWRIDTLSGRDAAHARTSNTALLPRVTLEHRPQGGTLERFGWLTLGRGYKGPGFNHYSSDGDAARSAYRPESNHFIELGQRWQAADASWSFGAAAFQYWLHQHQVIELRYDGNSTTSNARRTHVRGLELHASVRPVSSLQLSAFAGVIDARYDDFLNPVDGVDYTGERLPQTPKHAFGLGIAWQSNAYWETDISARRQGAALFTGNNRRNPAYTLVDASINYRIDAWTVGLYGKNLLDKVYYSSSHIHIAVPAAPRTIGLRAALDF